MIERSVLEKLSQIFMGILEKSSRDFAEVLNQAGLKNRVGFVAIAFEFGTGKYLGWVSSANRETMLKAIQEFIEKGGGTSGWT
jgi:hypothetical protein